MATTLTNKILAMSCGLRALGRDALFERLNTVDSIVAAGGLTGIEQGLADELEGFIKDILSDEKKREIWDALQLSKKEVNEEIAKINKRYAHSFKNLYDVRS